GRSVAVAQADGDGRFAAQVPTRGLPTGRIELDAVYRPTVSWHAETRSPPLTLELVPPTPPPLWAFALPALVTAIGFGGARLWRELRLARGRLVLAAPPSGAAPGLPATGG